MQDTCTAEAEVHIHPRNAKTPITISGDLGGLHDNPKKIHQLLDVLGLPSGTEVRVVTKAASVIVR